MDREKQNKILKANGYRWEKITQDWLDDNDDFETRPGWHLYKGNREVTIERAMREIEIGIEATEREYRKRDKEQFVRESIDIGLNNLRRQYAEYIQKHGTRPEEQPIGETILNTQNIYGGGDWFVIGNDCIWYIKNNGMDGDNWSYNNVRTGGAGAIGWKIDRINGEDDIVTVLRGLENGTIRHKKLKENGI